MLMNNIDKETRLKLTRQLTDMIIDSRDTMISKTIAELKKSNISHTVIDKIIKEFKDDAEHKLSLIPQVVSEMMENARNKAEISAVNYMSN